MKLGRGEELLLEENLVIEMLFGLFTTVLFHRARFSTQQRRYEYVSHERILVDFRRGRKRNGSFDFRRSNFPFQSIFLSLDIAPRGRKRANSFNVVSLLFTKRKKIIRALINIYNLYIREKMSILTYYMYITLHFI